EAAAPARFLIEPRVASMLEGRFGAVATEITSGRTPVMFQRGILSSSGRTLATMSESTLTADGRVVGYVRNGYLTDTADVRLARVRGYIPQAGAPIRLLETGEVFHTVRPMSVDIAEIPGGAYRLVLADGRIAVVDEAALSVVTLVGLAASQDCPPDGFGMLVRKSGEPVYFSNCQRDGSFVKLQVGQRTVILDADDVAEMVATTEPA
ncbi:MAG: hypothetical protein JWR84_1830, partial [Caulobacter sp.]|nr:hypothetical protein [Caulobacter sp.]